MPASPPAWELLEGQRPARLSPQSLSSTEHMACYVVGATFYLQSESPRLGDRDLEARWVFLVPVTDHIISSPQLRKAPLNILLVSFPQRPPCSRVAGCERSVGPTFTLQRRELGPTGMKRLVQGRLAFCRGRTSSRTWAPGACWLWPFFLHCPLSPKISSAANGF